jgi:hypothetical protein
MSGLAFAAGIIFWICFRKLDKEEDSVRSYILLRLFSQSSCLQESLRSSTTSPPVPTTLPPRSKRNTSLNRLRVELVLFFRLPFSISPLSRILGVLYYHRCRIRLLHNGCNGKRSEVFNLIFFVLLRARAGSFCCDCCNTVATSSPTSFRATSDCISGNRRRCTRYVVLLVSFPLSHVSATPSVPSNRLT